MVFVRSLLPLSSLLPLTGLLAVLVQSPIYVFFCVLLYLNSFSSYRVNDKDGGKLTFIATGTRAVCQVHVSYVAEENDNGRSISLESLFLRLPSGRRVSVAVSPTPINVDSLNYTGKSDNRSNSTDYVDADYEVHDEADDSPYGRKRDEWRKNVRKEKE